MRERHDSRIEIRRSDFGVRHIPAQSTSDDASTRRGLKDLRKSLRALGIEYTR